MKRFFPFVAFWFSMTVLSAQSAMERVIEIRHPYAEAQTMMLHAIEEPNMDNSMHIEMRRMFGGTGMQHYTIDYFSGDFSEEEPLEGVFVWSPYFIRVKYNWAARVTVTEGTYCTGSLKVTLPDGSEKSLDEELNAKIHPFDADADENNYVRYLISIHNQMMNNE